MSVTQNSVQQIAKMRTHVRLGSANVPLSRSKAKADAPYTITESTTETSVTIVN